MTNVDVSLLSKMAVFSTYVCIVSFTGRKLETVIDQSVNEYRYLLLF